MRLGLQLDQLKSVSHEGFECLNCLPATYRFKKCFNSIAFKYFNEQCLNYLSQVFVAATESNLHLRFFFSKIKMSILKD